MASPQSLEVARLARLIYDEQLRERLEREHTNEFVAIEPDSGSYFLGDTLSEAIQRARRAFPDRLVFAQRIATKFSILQLQSQS
jgi:hypothetical protein